MSREQVLEGYKQTEVGVIPEDWNVVSIGTLASFTSGSGIDMTTLKAKSSDTPFPVYGGNGIAGYTSQPLIEKITVVLGRVGQKCGVAYLTEEPAWITDNALYPRFISNDIDIGFLFLALKNAGLNDFRNRNDLPLVTQSIVHAAKIVLPSSCEEQEAIASTLSDIDNLLASLNRLIAKKRNLKQATMQQLLTGKKRLPKFSTIESYQETEIGKIPSDWKVQTLLELCEKIQDGTHFSPDVDRNGDYLYITSKNIGFGFLKLNDVDKIDESQHRNIYNRCDVRKGDILLTKDGVNTGNAALNILDEEFSLLSSVAILRFSNGQHSANYFLQQILSPEGQQRMKELMSGNAITRLTLEKIQKICFAVPSLSEQSEIAQVLTDMDTELTTLQTRRTKTQALKQAMMQELLTGRTRLV